jgi:hypothetical protein
MEDEEVMMTDQRRENVEGARAPSTVVHDGSSMEDGAGLPTDGNSLTTPSVSILSSPIKGLFGEVGK